MCGGTGAAVGMMFSGEGPLDRFGGGMLPLSTGGARFTPLLVVRTDGGFLTGACSFFFALDWASSVLSLIELHSGGTLTSLCRSWRCASMFNNVCHNLRVVQVGHNYLDGSVHALSMICPCNVHNLSRQSP